MAYFVCGKCLFCFERRGPVENCPNCGHTYIREAESKEIEEYVKNREEAGELKALARDYGAVKLT